MLQARGMDELRNAFARKLSTQNEMNANPESEVLVTNGAKQALHVLMASVLDAGDEVLFPTPSYVYAGTIELLGAIPRPVLMSEESGYRVDVERLEHAISSRTKMLLLNNPTNPTGVVARREELNRIVEMAARHNLVVIVDESHERLVFDDHVHISLASLPGAQERTVTVYSMSKAHNMMGFRVGFAVGPAPIISSAAAILEWETLANNFVSQAAATAVLTGPQGWLEELRRSCEANRNRLNEAISSFESIGAVIPEGGATHFLNVEQVDPSGRVVSDLLLDRGVPSDPGDVFGEDGHIRLTVVGTELSVLEEAIRRMAGVFS
jgi:aspartate/methionine/tyrosine aminotransferase